MTADGLRLAIGTFTAIRVPAPTLIDRRTARLAMVTAPLACLPMGIAAVGVGLGGRWAGLPMLVTAALTVGLVALSSRGLHLDGLADTADGLAASYDRDRAMEVMRRGNTGPMGASTLVLVLLIQVAATAELLNGPGGPVVVGGLVCLSRCSLLISCAAGVPAARPGGLGATVAGVVPLLVTGLGLALASIVATLLLRLDGSPWWLGTTAMVVQSLLVLGLVLRTRRRFGGITGDVLGAGIELGLAALLVVACTG